MTFNRYCANQVCYTTKHNQSLFSNRSHHITHSHLIKRLRQIVDNSFGINYSNMSDILDNKSDAEIEEIYSRATMEDLQSMLTQEKCLNRRRLLRKVMRCKSNNLSELSDLHKLEHKEKTIITQPEQNEVIKTSKDDHSKLNPVKFNSEFIQRKLNEMRKELHNTVDLTRRKELRKEIQELENSLGTQHKKIHVDSHSKKHDLSEEILSDKEKRENLFHNTENAKSPPKEISKVNDENEIKFNIIKATDSNQNVLNKEHSQTQTFNKEIPNEEKSNKISTISSNQNAVNKSLDKIHSEISIKNDLALSHPDNNDRNAQQNIKTKLSSSSHREISDKIPPVQIISYSKVNIPVSSLSLPEKKPQRNSPNMDSKPISRSNTTYSASPKPNQNQTNTDSSTPTGKKYISRVSSVREKFENPPITTNTIKNPTSSKMTEKEINDLVNAVLYPEKSDSVDHKLAVPNQPPRKISQPNIIGMIPQIKKVAKTARSTVQVKKEQLIIFCQQNTQEYQNVNITNYSKSWADGLAFCALIHHFYPDSFDYKTLSSNNPVANFTLAFDTAKKYAGIEPLIEPEDMVILESPDEKCVYTYVQFMYNALKSHPRNMVKYATNSEG